MFKQKFWLVAFAIYQLFVAALISIGSWPAWVVYVNLGIQLAAILAFDLEYATYSVVLSIPFYLAVPNPKFDSLSAWRFTFALLFAVFWYKHVYRAKNKLVFMKWDRALFWLALVAVFSIFPEPFKIQGIKKVLFVLNAYFIYVVVTNVFKERLQVQRLIKVVFSSLATIVVLGFVQLGATFSTDFYHFWQYWATMISRAYYGKTLSDTLVYSNSWFAFSKGAPPSLRMFSILPDSHAFAVCAMFAIPFAAALLFFTQKNWQKILLWIFIGLAAAGIVLSGTRGVWAAIVAPLVLIIILFAKRWGRKIVRPLFVPVLLFFLFLAVSPLISKGFARLHGSAQSGNDLQRAESIYSLSDPSNAGRIAIWKSTLKFAGQHLLLGSGFGDFVVTLNQNNNNAQVSYQQLAQQKVQAYNLPKQYVTAHNLYLDFFAETGILGLIGLVYFFWEIIAAHWKFFKKHYLFSDDGYVFLATNIALYMVWLFAYSVVDGTLLNDRVLMYFFISLGISGSILRAYLQTNAENRD